MTVYFIRRKSDPSVIKIGVAANINRRLSTIATGVGPIEMIGCMRGGSSLERLIHERFAADCVEGEWFSSTEALLSFIERDAKCPIRSYEPRSTTWKNKAADKAWDRDQIIAKDLLEKLISQYGREYSVAAAHEEIFNRLHALNGSWSRRRVRAIHEMTARRIDLFEAVDLLTVLGVKGIDWAETIGRKDK